ncbi:hypothetical protein [Luteimonas deserti]|uniref:DUF4124 domain-containing protein n=1 Tax=Luteimonas deserti TaxID=2752306 RepID=A0A7Z0TV87_9GAMM|nr:hypothetical protein [Luteimonas deserti]NYZ61984.1 hypothetical protein [Luteimonas deserti]
MTFHARLAAATLLVMATAAAAQNAPDRKVYCWDEGGRRVCGDALPGSAVNAPRTEISTRSGLTTAELARAPTAAERSAAEAVQRETRLAAEAEAAARRRELAMVESYATETDLRRAYGERIVLVEEAIKTSRMGVANLRTSLLSQLRQAGELELHAQPVGKALRDRIQSQRADLLRQLAVLDQQLGDQAALDGDLQAALTRYRELKQTASRD